MEKVIIETEFIKLDQFLKFIGVAQTGGEAKFLISEENVKINGVIATERGKKLHKGDVVDILNVGKFEIE